MNKPNILDWIAVILVVVGGLNWGLVGVANYNLVTALFGVGALTGIIYDLVGLSAIYLALVMLPKMMKK